MIIIIIIIKLIIKGISNIYLETTIEKNWRSQSFDFLIVKNRLQVSFWEAPTHSDVSKF